MLFTACLGIIAMLAVIPITLFFLVVILLIGASYTNTNFHRNDCKEYGDYGICTYSYADDAFYKEFEEYILDMLGNYNYIRILIINIVLLSLIEILIVPKLNRLTIHNYPILGMIIPIAGYISYYDLSNYGMCYDEYTDELYTREFVRFLFIMAGWAYSYYILILITN